MESDPPAAPPDALGQAKPHPCWMMIEPSAGESLEDLETNSLTMVSRRITIHNADARTAGQVAAAVSVQFLNANQFGLFEYGCPECGHGIKLAEIQGIRIFIPDRDKLGQINDASHN